MNYITSEQLSDSLINLTKKVIWLLNVSFLSAAQGIFFENESSQTLKCVNDSAAKVACLIVFSTMIFSGRSVDYVYVIRMAALCWRLGHLCGSVSLSVVVFVSASTASWRGLPLSPTHWMCENAWLLRAPFAPCQSDAFKQGQKQ